MDLTLNSRIIAHFQRQEELLWYMDGSTKGRREKEERMKCVIYGYVERLNRDYSRRSRKHVKQRRREKKSPRPAHFDFFRL